jgi:hypothetical protein
MTGNYLEGYPAYNTFVAPAKNEPVLNWRGPYVSTLLAGEVPLALPDGRLLLFFDGASVTSFRWHAGSHLSGPASRRSAWR